MIEGSTLIMIFWEKSRWSWKQLLWSQFHFRGSRRIATSRFDGARSPCQEEVFWWSQALLERTDYDVNWYHTLEDCFCWGDLPAVAMSKRIEPSFLRVQNTDHLFFLCWKLGSEGAVFTVPSWMSKLIIGPRVKPVQGLSWLSWIC